MRSIATLVPLLSLLLALAFAVDSAVGETEAASSAQRGYELLTTKAYLPPRLNQALFDQLWKSWEPVPRESAAKASEAERMQMAFHRYGFTSPPAGKPAADGGQVQYVVDQRGNWTMNCMACHQGEVAGRVIPGVPNTRFAMQTFSEDIRQTRLLLDQRLRGEDLGSMIFPMGGSNGTTNAVMFGVVLKHYRDADLNLRPDRSKPQLTHHDMDAPAWWHFKKKTRLYADGFAPKSVRALMPFLLVEQNGPEQFRQWEADFEHIYTYLESLEAPAYPFEIDRRLAGVGEALFVNHCADCHGTYGTEETYPEKIIPLAKIGTDPVRLRALTVENRRDYAASWFAAKDAEQDAVVVDPGGYLAPPLDGVWASAPYFHNGSVPTLWHVLYPDERPKVWRRSTDEEQPKSEFDQRDGYDRTRVGLAVRAFERGPGLLTAGSVKRQYFDTTKFGKSAAGHTFPDELNDEEKRAVLEYLKTL